MARPSAPSLSALAALLLSLGIAVLVLPQLVLCVATMTHSEGQENFDPSLPTPSLTHEYENGSEDKVNSWRVALTNSANLAGLHLKPYRLESEFIEEIVENIWKILNEESATAPSYRQIDVSGQQSVPIIPPQNHASSRHNYDISQCLNLSSLTGALVLGATRMKFVGVDELPGPAPTQHGSEIDHSFPFLESLNKVLETNRAEESQSHVHRMYFMGPNTFSEPWHLPHTPPEQIKEILYEDAFNRFVDKINAIAAYQWWEGAIYSILSVLAYPLAWSWQLWRRRLKLQRLHELVRSEYDYACLRSCRSRALYEGIKLQLLI
nr:hypothetical protein CFP56_03609 [Quercus suber]